MARAIALAVLAAVLLTVCILTWGSLGSAVMLLGLILMGSAVLYQKFMTNREEDRFRPEE